MWLKQNYESKSWIPNFEASATPFLILMMLMTVSSDVDAGDVGVDAGGDGDSVVDDGDCDVDAGGDDDLSPRLGSQQCLHWRKVLAKTGLPS